MSRRDEGLSNCRKELGFNCRREELGFSNCREELGLVFLVDFFFFFFLVDDFRLTLSLLAGVNIMSELGDCGGGGGTTNTFVCDLAFFSLAFRLLGLAFRLVGEDKFFDDLDNKFRKDLDADCSSWGRRPGTMSTSGLLGIILGASSLCPDLEVSSVAS